MLLEFLLCFLIGSIPFSVILSKIFLKDDIRNVGSGNIGTTNAYRVGGAKFATIVALLDIAKGYFAVQYIMSGAHGLALLAVCLGQMFSPFLMFKGGKGVGCYIGSLVGIDVRLGLVFGASWILLVKLLKQPFLASFLILGGSILVFENNYYKFLAIALILFKHIDNVQRFVKKDLQD